MKLLPAPVLDYHLVKMRKLHREISEAILVVDYLGIAKQGLDLLMAVRQCFNLGKKRCFHYQDTKERLLKGRALVPLVVNIC